MKKIELKFSSLVPAMSQQYVLILQEVEGNHKLPIVIGLNEAQSIAVEVNEIERLRPLTHDLFVSTLSAFGIDLIEVNLTKIEEGVFFSELICEQISTGIRLRIDSRTSDAIALALRFKCKIFADDEVIRKASFTLEDIESNKSLNEQEIIERKIEDLEEKLEQAIKDEEFELAAQIKKEIQVLKNKLF